MATSNIFLVFFISLFLGYPGCVLAETYELRPGLSDISMRDLQNLAYAVGVEMAIFDYEAADNHCLHFFIEITENENPVETIDSRGECGLAGPRRLTIQWQEEDGKVQFRFWFLRRDIRQGGSVASPRIDVAGYAGWHGGAHYVVPPKLQLSEHTPLAVLRYSGTVQEQESDQSETERSKEITVLGELRANPDGIIGTEQWLAE